MLDWRQVLSIYIDCFRFQIVIDCHRHHSNTWTMAVMVRFSSVQYIVVHIANEVGRMPQYSKRIFRWNWEIYFFGGKLQKNEFQFQTKSYGIHSVIQANLKKISQWNARSLKPLDRIRWPRALFFIAESGNHTLNTM